jgi:hypothetical protein
MQFGLKFKVLFGIAITMVVVIVTLMLLERDPGAENTEPVGTTFPVGADRVLDEQEKDSLESVLKSPNTTNLGDGAYLVSGSAAANDSSKFHILYFEPDKSYTVTLLEQPLKGVRTEAENALLALFGWSREEACIKPVRVSVPIDVDARYGGQSLGLSFCPGAVLLP